MQATVRRRKPLRRENPIFVRACISLVDRIVVSLHGLKKNWSAFEPWMAVWQRVQAWYF
jgi:hypothetical protein